MPRHLRPDRRKLSTRTVVSGAIATGLAIALTAALAIALAGSSQSASGKTMSPLRVVQAQLCTALAKALPSAMRKPTSNPYGMLQYRTGYDKKSRTASCRINGAHSNVATLYQFMGTGAKANKSAYQANVKLDQSPSRPNNGCSMADQGPLDTSPQNAIPGTKTGYGCNMEVGTTGLGTRVDALTTSGRSVSFSIACAPSVLRNESALMVAQAAIHGLAKAA